ncbi:MAG: hypothetical protein K1X94_05575 [Sandaracinaceae bacterium]|nr:hypothetical protein [Sandaracinaceae bacterium]
MRTTSGTLLALSLASFGVGCSCDENLGADAGPSLDAAEPPDAVGMNDDAARADAGTDAASSADAASDAATDGGGDAGTVFHYDCGAFSEASGWVVREGYRAVVVADVADGLSEPVAVTFAEGAYGGMLFVVSSGSDTVHRVDVATGTTTAFTTGAAWGATAPSVLTTIMWDATGVLDGALYVGDQGGDGDADSVLYRVASDGTASVATRAPGAGLDDIYALTFSPPGSAYPPGLYLAGDTDGSGVDWGVFDGTTVSAFSEVTGVEGASFDPTGLYGGSLWASRPGGGGYAGDASITPISAAGVAGTPIFMGDTGIHAVTFSERGTFGARMYAASWSTGSLFEIAPEGTSTTLATGLSLTNYDGNILAVSSDGEVMFVADRLANRVVCIEPI